MEIKEIQEITTLGDLTAAVEYYRDIQEEISRLELSKKIARESIMEKFRETGMRHYDTSSNLRARVDTRTGKQWIDVKEAKTLLDSDTFNKLLKQGGTIVVLSVRPVGVGEEEGV